MTARHILALTLLVITSLCSGCGHKGDLYLPDSAAAALDRMR